MSGGGLVLARGLQGDPGGFVEASAVLAVGGARGLERVLHDLALAAGAHEGDGVELRGDGEGAPGQRDRVDGPGGGGARRVRSQPLGLLHGGRRRGQEEHEGARRKASPDHRALRAAVALRQT